MTQLCSGIFNRFHCSVCAFFGDQNIPEFRFGNLRWRNGNVFFFFFREENKILFHFHFNSFLSGEFNTRKRRWNGIGIKSENRFGAYQRKPAQLFISLLIPIRYSPLFSISIFACLATNINVHTYIMHMAITFQDAVPPDQFIHQQYYEFGLKWHWLWFTHPLSPLHLSLTLSLFAVPFILVAFTLFTTFYAGSYVAKERKRNLLNRVDSALHLSIPTIELTRVRKMTLHTWATSKEKWWKTEIISEIKKSTANRTPFIFVPFQPS